MTAIAQCTATLELGPCSSSVEAYVRRTLPIYGAKHGISEGASGSVFMDDAPFSKCEVQEACRKECAFECHDMIWRPDASMLLSLWRSITSAATLNGVDIVKPAVKASLVQVIKEDDFPTALIDAVLARLAFQDVNLEEGCKSLQACCPTILTTAADFLFDQVLCVNWIGGVFLECCSQSRIGVNAANFIAEWRELLPESWIGLAKLETLDVGLLENLSCILTYPRTNIVKFRKRASSSVRLFRPKSPDLEHQALREGEARESGTRSSRLREDEEIHLTPCVLLVRQPFDPVSWMSSVIMPSQAGNAVPLPVRKLTGRVQFLRCLEYQ